MFTFTKVKKLVIVIDDDADDIQFLRETIAEVDGTLDCISFDSPTFAITQLSASNHRIPAYIFIDFNMPKMNGFECFSLLQKQKKFAGTRFIINSTTIDDQTKKRFLAMGGHQYIRKPITASAYRKLVAQVFE